MELSKQQIFEAALALPRDIRLQLVEQLIESFDPVNDADIDAAWMIEIERRIDEVNRGEVRTIPTAEVFARIKDARKP